MNVSWFTKVIICARGQHANVDGTECFKLNIILILAANKGRPQLKWKMVVVDLILNNLNLFTTVQQGESLGRKNSSNFQELLEWMY